MDRREKPSITPAIKSVFRADVPPKALTDKTDAFGHRDYASTVASAAAEAEAPFTLALFGPWGVGKTTILEEVGRRLPSNCSFAIFDAWRYQGDALRRSFLSEVSRQLTDRNELPGYDRESALEELTTPISTVRPAGLMFRRENAIRAVVSASFVFLLVFLALRLGFKVGKSVLGSAISAVVTLAVFLLGSVGQIFDIKYETVTRPRVEDPERFTEKFEDLLAHLSSDRLVIAIDNLDRCPPERIEEVFDTLNTFLEPAGAVGRAQGLSAKLKSKRAGGAKKEAVFIVAADDEALKRHLEARERRASGRRPDVGHYADEYLRKIFKAAIPIKPLLDADMRSYVETELKRFFEARDVRTTDQVALVEITAAALKGNPRRVRQFVNNMELRIRLIKTREDSTRIAEELSKNILVVAKLTLLEEEWPTSYEMIARDPRVLDEWHAKQLDGDLSGVPAEDRDDPAFRAFLNVSRGIRSPYLPAFISLKQSKEELLLPRFSDFRDALIAGNADALAEVMADADDETSLRYAQQLLPLFQQEAARGYVDAARSIVERAVAEPHLTRHTSILDSLLREAARNYEVRPQLRLADPRPIFSEGQRLSAEEFGLLVDPFTDLAAFKEEGNERLAQVIEALAAAASKLPNKARRAVRESLATDEVSSSFGEYLPLAKSDPTLLPTEAGGKALDAFAAEPDVVSPAFEVLRLWFGEERPSEQQDRFASLVGQPIVSLGQAGGGSEEEQKAVAEMVAVASRLPSITDGTAEAVMTNLQQAMGSGTLSVALLPSSLDLAGSLANRRHDGSNLVEPLVTGFSSQDPDGLIEYAFDLGEDVAPPLKGQILPQLSQHVSAVQNLGRQERAAAAILRILPDDERGFLSAAIEDCARRDDFVAVGALIEAHRGVLGEGLSKIVSTLLERARQLGSTGADAIVRLLELAESMSDDQRDDLRSLIRDAMTELVSTTGTIDQLRSVIDRAEETRAFGADYDLLVREIWDAVKGQSDPQQPLLEFVIERFGRLDKDRRAALITQFGNWLTQNPHLRIRLSELAARISDPKAREREQLVEKIIDAERLESEPSTRTPMLKAAEIIAGAPRAARARNRLLERLKALEQGSDADRVVWRSMTDENS
jgi:hypothetical protein